MFLSYVNEITRRNQKLQVAHPQVGLGEMPHITDILHSRNFMTRLTPYYILSKQVITTMVIRPLDDPT